MESVRIYILESLWTTNPTVLSRNIYYKKCSVTLSHINHILILFMIHIVWDLCVQLLSIEPWSLHREENLLRRCNRQTHFSFRSWPCSISSIVVAKIRGSRWLLRIALQYVSVNATLVGPMCVCPSLNPCQYWSINPPPLLPNDISTPPCANLSPPPPPHICALNMWALICAAVLYINYLCIQGAMDEVSVITTYILAQGCLVQQ